MGRWRLCASLAAALAWASAAQSASPVSLQRDGAVAIVPEGEEAQEFIDLGFENVPFESAISSPLVPFSLN